MIIIFIHINFIAQWIWVQPWLQRPSSQSLPMRHLWSNCDHTFQLLPRSCLPPSSSGVLSPHHSSSRSAFISFMILGGSMFPFIHELPWARQSKYYPEKMDFLSPACSVIFSLSDTSMSTVRSSYQLEMLKLPSSIAVAFCFRIGTIYNIPHISLSSECANLQYVMQFAAQCALPYISANRLWVCLAVHSSLGSLGLS